jgi:hypothetical protein
MYAFINKTLKVIFLSFLTLSLNPKTNAMGNTSNTATYIDNCSQFLENAKQFAIKAGISTLDSVKIATEKFQRLISKTDIEQLKKSITPAALTFIFCKLFSSTDILGLGFCIVFWDWILSNSPTKSSI